jgi:hypothetical protein
LAGLIPRRAQYLASPPAPGYTAGVRILIATLALGLGSAEAVPSGELHDLEWIGFQNTADGSRIFLRTNEPVQYRVSEKPGGMIVVDLFNTRIGNRNQRRALDTSQFDTAILEVKAEELEGASKQVRLEIKMRAKVAYEAKQDDRALNLDFKRPAG